MIGGVNSTSFGVKEIEKIHFSYLWNQNERNKQDLSGKNWDLVQLKEEELKEFDVCEGMGGFQSGNNILVFGGQHGWKSTTYEYNPQIHEEVKGQQGKLTKKEELSI